ncbi:MAG: enoyl-CoA hydratase/isomerase family protein [Myxococcales bacterium]|nr:MAG: enoyl-CoA hydratase/isomerase family protein [Myxococcales bacterium]
MPNVRWEKIDSVARIVMGQGENRHNPTFLEEILAAFDAVEADPTNNAVILASEGPKCWSLGLDLDWLMAAAGDPARHDEVKRFLYRENDLFARALLFPMPVIAALSGHTFGAGAILASACDFRLMRADRGFWCFPEIDVSIPFLPGMWAIVRKAFPYPLLEELTLTGRRTTATELERRHAILKACPDLAALDAEALAFAKSFSKGRGIFGEVKRRMNSPIVEVFQRDDPNYIERLQLTA